MSRRFYALRSNGVGFWQARAIADHDERDIQRVSLSPANASSDSVSTAAAADSGEAATQSTVPSFSSDSSHSSASPSVEGPLKRQRTGDARAEDVSLVGNSADSAVLLLPSVEAVAGVPGLYLSRDFVSAEEASALIQNVDANEEGWDRSLSRRTMHFGHRYDYKNRISAEQAPPVPSRSDFVVSRMQLLRWYTCLKHSRTHESATTDDATMTPAQCQECAAAVPRQLIINEYLPGQGIAAHIDQRRDFGPVVTTLSLLSRVDMVFSCQGKESVVVALPPRSLAILSGDARYVWKHAIPGRKSDPAAPASKLRVQRGRRVSLTFRTLTQQS